MMNGIRYANIGAVVAAAIMVAGVLLFKDSSEAAMQEVAMIGFVVGAAVYYVLDERATRRGKNHPQ
jgi:membrane protein YqaA with SNARE-associated domain